MKTPQYTCEMKAPGKAKLEVYDDIGPSWAGMIDAKLISKSLNDAGEVDEIAVHINSRGGSAYEGLAIATILKDHPAKVNVFVDGIAASAASLIAMAGDTVRIPKNALMMLHDPMTFAFGGEEDMTKALALLKSVKKAGVELYVEKSGKSAEEVAAIMKAETWYTGEEAVAAGFADTTEKAMPKDKAPAKEKASQSFREAWSFLPTVSLSLPKEPAMAESTKTPEVPATPPAVPAATPASVLTAADVMQAATSAAKQALDTERARAAEINALCALAGKPEMATKYIGDGTSVVDAQKAMYEIVCKDRKPADDPQSGLNEKPDENSKYKKEYKANPHLSIMSEEDYIATRRIDDGIDKLGKKVA